MGFLCKTLTLKGGDSQSSVNGYELEYATKVNGHPLQVLSNELISKRPILQTTYTVVSVLRLLLLESTGYF